MHGLEKEDNEKKSCEFPELPDISRDEKRQENMSWNKDTK